MRLVDSHAHLGDERFDDDRAEVLERARAAGVEAVVVIGHDAASSARVAEIVADGPSSPTPESPALFGAVGFAPHDVEAADAESLAGVRGLLRSERIVAVGEVGLDYHYDMPKRRQREVLVVQLEWAAETALPVVVHSRESEDDVVAALRDFGGRGVIHCFTESGRMAAAVLKLGFFVSFSGILTFGNAGDLRAVAATVPLERTLIETDSPWLAPHPWRGKRNEPARVEEVARTLAAIHDVSPEQVALRTSANARELFGLPAR